MIQFVSSLANRVCVCVCVCNGCVVDFYNCFLQSPWREKFDEFVWNQHLLCYYLLTSSCMAEQWWYTSICIGSNNIDHCCVLWYWGLLLLFSTSGALKGKAHVLVMFAALLCQCRHTTTHTDTHTHMHAHTHLIYHMCGCGRRNNRWYCTRQVSACPLRRP